MKNTKRNWKIYISLAVVALIVTISGIFWYIDYSSYIKTDDAYLTSDNISVSSKLLGRVNKLYVDEGDSVRKGQLLVELDSMDLLAQKEQVITVEAQTEATKAQAEAKYQLDIKNVKVLQISLERIKDDFDRATVQFTGGVITKEQFDHAQKAMETAQAQLEASQAQADVSKTQIKSAETAIATAQAQVDVISTQLSNTKLYSPTDGVVAKRWLLPGDIAQPGQSIFTINNDKKFWVLVYLEETKLSSVYLGQSAKFTLDAFPGVNFKGKIFTIGASTASQFSLIPPNNASGNFTKVTQRVPLKISVEGTENNDNLSSFNFMTGMSAVVKIIKKS